MMDCRIEWDLYDGCRLLMAVVGQVRSSPAEVSGGGGGGDGDGRGGGGGGGGGGGVFWRRSRSRGAATSSTDVDRRPDGCAVCP